MKKQVLIIGAGIAGLTAGVYAQRSGFDVTIVEQHNIPGGMCTAWKRKGYFFDGSMHWLTGSSPNVLNTMWREVGALNDDIPIRYDAVFRSLEWEGKVIYLYRDIDRTAQHFKEIAPEDAASIDRFAKDVRNFTKMQIPVTNIKGLKTKNKPKNPSMLGMLPILSRMSKLNNMTTSQYCACFRHPGLNTLMNSVITNPGMEYSAMSLVVTLATLASGDGGYPEGGSLAMARRMADTFTSLGGKIVYGKKADKVIVKDGRAVGITVNGEEMRADAVVITREVLAALELFDKMPKDEWVMKLQRDPKPAACCFISLGVHCELKETPSFVLPEPMQVAGFSYELFGFNNYFDYAGYAPEGGTSLTCFFGGDSYDFWKKAKDEGRYEEEKEALAQKVIRALCQRYPQCEGNIDVIDVATPLTYERYTGSYHGAWMSIMTAGNSPEMSSPCTLEGIDALYFAGHRVMQPGGMPSALLTGRTAAQMVCRQFDTVFV